MILSSNIDQVLGQLERLKTNIPKAVQEVLGPERWVEPARRMAKDILTALAKPEELRFIPAFINTVAGGLIDGELSLRMHSPAPALLGNLTLEEAQAARSLTQNRDLGMGIFDQPVRTFEELILKFVETPKEEGGKKRDARDWGKNDEDVALLISRIMLTPDPTPKEKEAREKLWPHIMDWLRKNQAQELPAATVDLWLRAVLAGWREMIKLYFPSLLRHELRGMQ